LLSLKAQKTLVFTGANSADKSGAWGKMIASLSGNVEIQKYSEIEPEPCTETVQKMIEELKEYQPDEVVAIGGGSPIDAAKAAYLVYQAGGDLNDYFGVNKFSEANPGKKLKRVICIPTSSGTGSEATPYSNIVDHKLNVKKLIVEEQIIPEYSFIDPTLTVSMPENVTKATGLDALAHSLEGFLNVGQDSKCPEANKWALASIKLIVKNLPKALEDPKDIEARAALSAAACLGGMVIRNKSTGLPHLCSFSWFGKIEHGIAAATLLPSAWAYYLESEKVEERTLELQGIFSETAKSPQEILNAYVDFLRKLSVPVALKEHKGIDKELLRQTAKTAGENKMKLELSPKPVPLEKSEEVLSEILENAWEGKYGDNA
jgi:alcohol dehydrogenase class IV